MRIRDRRFHQLDARELYGLLKLRTDVFVVEQECAYSELDGRDLEPDARHVWTGDGSEVQAYLRVLTEPDGARRIGRVATAPGARGRGLAGRLLRHVLSRSPGPWRLDAQVQLRDWYESFGFEVSGPEFSEDGIPHVPMRRGGGEPATPTSTVRVRMLVAYDGAPFRGFAPNPGVRTVAGDLADALAVLVGHPVTLTAAGRTDAGVHARAQVVTFDIDASRFDSARLRRSLNQMCGPEIVVGEVALAAPDFDARHSATGRTYRYDVLARPMPDPLRRHTTWHVPEPLDVEAMNLAAARLIGVHDFASFCRRHEGRTTLRTVGRAEWTSIGDVARFEIEADAFCHQMVRSIVGTLVAVGRGDRTVSDVGAVLAARDRSAAPTVAPACGLALWSVQYEDAANL